MVFENQLEDYTFAFRNIDFIMVHLVSSHHFVSQEVFQSQHEPFAFCCSQGKILIATEDRTIEVHDLDSRGNILHSFSSIDQVAQIIYCDAGNYIATLERQFNKHLIPVSHVRVYFNWWIDQRGQPIKVRIAGSSPTSNADDWSDHFETVELPLNKTSLCIACCRTTAALAVGIGKTISVFCFNAKPSKLSKLRPRDFSHFIDIEMNFVVRELNLCKNYFACASTNQVHAFKVSVMKEDLESEDKNNHCQSNSKKHLDDHFVEWCFEPCNGSMPNWTWENSLKKKLHENSFPSTITLPAIERENRNSERPFYDCEVIGPRLTANGYRIKIKLDPNAFELWPSLSSTNIDSVTLLYREFEFQDVEFQLMALHLISFYEPENYDRSLDPLHAAAVASQESFSSLPWSTSNLDAQPQLKAIGCFFSTAKQGFLYDVTEETKLIGTYTYTALLKSAVLDSMFLHALTDAGLETYTLHLSHCAFHYVEKLDNVRNICPDYSSPICLLGLRPFLGTTRLVMAKNHLVVISSLEDMEQSTEEDNDGGCTLYALKKPTPQQVFSDLLEAGQTYKSSSPSTYNLILKEGHMILRTHLYLCGNYDPEAEILYRKSCILLADYYACSSAASERHLAVPYYHLSELPLEEIVQKLLGFQIHHKNCTVMKTLVMYLNTVLLNGFFPEVEKLGKSSAEGILDAYSEEAPDKLWNVILCSGLCNYRIEKAMLILKRRITSKRHLQTSNSIAADTIAIVNLSLRKGNVDSAQNMYMSILKGDLIDVLAENSHLVWSENTLTHLGKLTKKARPDAFVGMLVRMVKKKEKTVDEALKLLQNESPDVSVSKALQVKEFLENYWKDCKTEFHEDSSSQVILLNIYLERLGKKSPISPSAKSSFSFRTRPWWLNMIPPFNGQPIARNCVFSPKNGTSNEGQKSSICYCFSCNEDLIKVQCLLSHPMRSAALIQILRSALLETNSDDIEGHESLEVLSLDEDEAISKILDSYPKALFQFAKDTFKNNPEKWANIVRMLDDKMKELSETDENYEVYSKTFHKCLSHAAEILSVPMIVDLLPPEKKEILRPYVKRCCERHQAQKLRNKIVALGNEIKLML